MPVLERHWLGPLQRLARDWGCVTALSVPERGAITVLP